MYCIAFLDYILAFEASEGSVKLLKCLYEALQPEETFHSITLSFY